MTDGPFKNLKLDSRSKRFAEAVQNDAVDQENRCALANHAILNGILPENQAILRDLHSYGQDGQLDLDPQGSIMGIFDAHPKSGFSDHLQREVRLRLHEGESSQTAINNGLVSALETYICEFHTRIHESGLEPYREGQMYQDQYNRLLEGTDRAIIGVDRPRIIDALKKGDKNAFKQDIKKKQGLDEGPKI